MCPGSESDLTKVRCNWGKNGFNDAGTFSSKQLVSINYPMASRTEILASGDNLSPAILINEPVICVT